MTSWTTCWRRSQRLGLVCLDLASPSTSPPSSSTVSSASTTASVTSSWVRSHRQTGGKRATGFWPLTLCPSRGTSVRHRQAGEAEEVPANWFGWAQQVRTGVHTFVCTYKHKLTPVSCVLLSLRPAVDFPDALCLLEEAEGAPDPLFGVMQYAMPSPNTLIQVPKYRRRFNI